MDAQSAIEIVPVNTPRRVKEFIDFPNRLYRSDPVYVPRLYLQQRESMSRTNPYFRLSEAGFFLARRNGGTIGRIAWFLNNNHVTFSARREMLFGFFDSVNDLEVAESLLAVVHREAAARACTTVLGPIEFSTNDTCGLLIHGFNAPPSVLMPYNASYYEGLLRRAGYVAVQELHAYEIRVAEAPAFLSPLSDRLVLRLAARGIRVRTMDFSRFDQEVDRLFPLYERMFSDNWGYMPLTPAEFRHQAEGLRQISIPEFVLIAEQNGSPIGYAVGLFDANRIIASFRNGRLLPFNFVKLLRLKRVNHVKIINLGVVPEYRGRGIDAVMYHRFSEAFRTLGIDSVEASYVMGSNRAMKEPILHMNGRLTKKYAIFRYSLSS